MKYRADLFSCLWLVSLLLAACGDQSSTKYVELGTYENGQITYAIDRQEQPLSREQSIRIHKEVRSSSPSETKLPILDFLEEYVVEDISVEMPIWSPNGESLMFLEAGRIKTVGADGTGKADIGECREITPDEWNFVWSPNSQRVAHACYDSISVVSKDGTRGLLAASDERRKLVNTPIGWSGDGQYLLFVQYSASGNPEDFVDGRDNRPLTFYKIPVPETLPEEFSLIPQRKKTELARWPIEDIYGYIMHPNGQEIAVTKGDNTVILLSIDRGDQRPLLASEFAELDMWSDIKWSPDGQWISFITGEYGSNTLWVMPSSGRGDRHQVAYAPAFNVWQWSPDSKELLFSSVADRIDGFAYGQGLSSFVVETKDIKSIVEKGEKGIEITSASWQPLLKDENR